MLLKKGTLFKKRTLSMEKNTIGIRLKNKKNKKKYPPQKKTKIN